jgi:protein phosphatase methylesterase 1
LKNPIERYEWRIDLTKTEKYWTDWFKGLSKMYLNVNVPKLLLLAGVDRLDKDLMVGQMQGKFQMQILPKCGHAVHEDSPDEVADSLANFVLRHKLTEALEEINPPSLSC